MSTRGPGSLVSRRIVIKGVGGVMLSAVLPGCGTSSAPAGATGSLPPAGPGAGNGATTPVGFLTADELVTLRAFVDRLIPEDTDPGAVIACCAEAIDNLLGAFLSEPPFIYAGAPFSDRGGAADNDFLSFLPLDAYEDLAWRITVEGSQGLAQREFNGPVKGLQAIYREGLARLNEQAQAMGQADFASAPAPVRDQIIGNSDDPLIADLVDVGFPDTLDAMYGAPEYGGNCELVGWGFTAFEGDVQPRGYTDEQVVNADNPGLLDALLPPSYHESSGVGAAAASSKPLQAPRAASLSVAPSSEQAVALMTTTDGRWQRMRVAMRGAAQAERQSWQQGHNNG